jgi:hypothetical protein
MQTFRVLVWGGGGVTEAGLACENEAWSWSYGLNKGKEGETMRGVRESALLYSRRKSECDISAMPSKKGGGRIMVRRFGERVRSLKDAGGGGG